MSIGKYSPTIVNTYNDSDYGDDGYDQEGYDMYGYNSDGYDRAGHTEDEYLLTSKHIGDELVYTLFEEILRKY